MSQRWRDITFAHWRVDPAAIASLLPPGVRPDVHDGSSWVGLIPFRMLDAGLGHGPGVPWLGTFLETNVRLYSVDDLGRHGVVFCSLEADRLAVVLGANAGFGVPYKFARMTYADTARPAGTAPDGRRLRYETIRRTRPHPHSLLEVEVGAPIPEPSALEIFLTARFGLHTRRLGRTWWIPNTHGPWPLHRGRITALDDELVAAAGLPGVASGAPDSVLFSPGVRTQFGLPRRL